MTLRVIHLEDDPLDRELVAAYLMTGARRVDGYLIDQRVPIALPIQAAEP